VSFVQVPQEEPEHTPLQFTVCAGGHDALVPGQLAGRVATLLAQLAARHSNVSGWKPSVGQLGLVPVQLSATSQPPAAAARHCVPEPRYPSDGQSTELPSHASATSQPPLVAARHCVPAPFFPSGGHAADVPEQVSAWSQIPTAGRHDEPLVL
jgi:hypothetical protein